MVDPTTDSRLTVRAARPGDIPSVAQMHGERIGEGYLAALGIPFLSVLYRRMLLDGGSFVQVAGYGGQVDGFVAGSVDTGTLYRSFLRRDVVRAVAAGRSRLVRTLPRALETLLYGRASSESQQWPPAELLSLAVSGDRAGGGIGGRLVEAFTTELRCRNVGSARVVVAAGNDRALHVYLRGGFRPAGQLELHRGRSSHVLRWDDPGP